MAFLERGARSLLLSELLSGLALTLRYMFKRPVTVNYPFSFIVLNPVANLVVSGTAVGTPITLTAAAEMRNEAQ